MRTLLAALVLAATPAFADDKPKSDSLDDLVNTAPPAPDMPAPAPEKIAPPPTRPAPAPPVTDDAAAMQQETPPPRPAIVVKPAQTEVTPVAAAPSLLAPIAAPPSKPRLPGPYELGAIDCRVLDASGIERVLPKRLLFGAEPDLLCRVGVTQPSTVARAEHTLVMTVFVGARATYRQKRVVRIGALGRRSVVFVIPSDVIVNDEPKVVTVRVEMTLPATPKLREARIPIETED